MALINCLECSKEISDKAKSCPKCGAPVVIKEEPLGVGGNLFLSGCMIIFFSPIIILFIYIIFFYDSSTPSTSYTPTNTVSSSQKESVKESLALIINLSGNLCAKVKDVRPLSLKDRYEVTCIEYRGGSSTKSYLIDAKKGSVIPQ